MAFSGKKILKGGREVENHMLCLIGIWAGILGGYYLNWKEAFYTHAVKKISKNICILCLTIFLCGLFHFYNYMTEESQKLKKGSYNKRLLHISDNTILYGISDFKTNFDES